MEDNPGIKVGIESVTVSATDNGLIYLEFDTGDFEFCVYLANTRKNKVTVDQFRAMEMVTSDLETDVWEAIYEQKRIIGLDVDLIVIEINQQDHTGEVPKIDLIDATPLPGGHVKIGIDRKHGEVNPFMDTLFDEEIVNLADGDDTLLPGKNADRMCNPMVPILDLFDGKGDVHNAKEIATTVRADEETVQERLVDATHGPLEVHETGFILAEDESGEDDEDTGETDNSDQSDSLDPNDVLEQQAEMYKEKNSDYGEAWRLAGETMSMWAETANIEGIDPSNEKEMISLCLYIQRLHKLIRGFNLEMSGDQPNFEGIQDSHRDELTYASMHASLFEGDDG